MFVCKPPLRPRHAVVLLRKCLYLFYLKGSDSPSVPSLQMPPLCGGGEGGGIAADLTSLSVHESPFFCCILQAPTARYRIHETPEQSGQHRPCDCKSRHINAGGEGLLQTKGKGLAALIWAPISCLPSPPAPFPLPQLPLPSPAGLGRRAAGQEPSAFLRLQL